MGNCTATILKKGSLLGRGDTTLVKLNGSTSYATNGDPVPRSILGLPSGKSNPRLTALLVLGGHTSPGGHQVEVIPAANEYTDPKIRYRTPAGAEVGAATNLSGESVYAIALRDGLK